MKVKVQIPFLRRWTALLIALCAATLAVSARGAAAELRIAVIDMRKVFEDYYKTKAANAKLKERLVDLEKEQKALVDQYQKAKEEYKRSLDDANDQALSIDEREKRKKSAEGKLLDVQTLQQTIDDFNKTARTSLDEQERSLRDKIMGEIKGVVGAKAKASGFTMVFDTAAETVNRTPMIPYASGENDLTAEVLKELNAAAPASISSGSAKNEDKK
jgi:outer membrane protein